MIHAPRRISTSVYLTEIQPDVLLGLRKVKYLDGLPSHPRPHARARGFLRENRRFSRDSPAATQFEGKKHCASFVGSSGTCSPPPRQQLINRSALSPETTGDASSGFFVVVNGVSYRLFFLYRYKKRTVARLRRAWRFS